MESQSKLEIQKEVIDKIYKICLLSDKGIKKLYIFLGNFKKDKVEPLIFNSEEIKLLAEQSVELIYLPISLYGDDSISVIKRKIMLYEKISFDEIYFFTQSYTKLNAVNIYQSLTKNGRQTLTKNTLEQFLSNIKNESDFELKTLLTDKPEYDYDDILSLNINDKYFLINKLFGQKFMLPEAEESFTVNPFEITKFDEFTETYMDRLLVTTNKSLLLDVDNIFKNAIYMCLAEDVYTFIKDKDLSKELVTKLYYPYLFERNINNLEQLIQEKSKLLAESANLIDTNFVSHINKVALFHNIYNTQKFKIDYSEVGITACTIGLIPAFKFNLPTEMLFKVISSSSKIPYIKYNPGRRLNNLYRLYSPGIAENGKRIPFLNKATIFKLKKLTSPIKGISYYVMGKFREKQMSAVVNINSLAKITVDIEYPDPLFIDEVEKSIAEIVNPLIRQIDNFLQQAGYKLALFTSIISPQVQILNIDYQFRLSIDKIFNLNLYMACVSSIFNIEESDIRKVINLRYKRVSNYNEMDSIEEYILGLLDKEVSELKIIEQLIKVYSLTKEFATTKLADVLSSLQTIRTLYSNKQIKSKSSAGFPTIIKQVNFTNDILIKITGINNIKYLEYIYIYIDTLIRLSQYPDSSDVPFDVIKETCSSISEDIVEDIVSVKEAANPEAQAVGFLPDDDDDDETDLMGILLGSDSEAAEDDGDGVELGDDDGIDFGDDIELGDDIEFGSDIDQEGGMDLERTELTKDITGLPLNNPNPFYKRLEARDPSLFVYEEDANFKAYSRMCPWNVRRQPVILTDREKERIDKEHPGSYDKAIKYGSSPEKQHWYICPRYWSLKDDTSLTEEEVKSGNYGTIIPQGAKTVPAGANIFEFNSDKEHRDKNGRYIQHNPGFIKEQSGSDKFCLPCCFKSWDTPAQVKRRAQCLAKNEGEAVPTLTKQVEEDYIKGPDKLPLDAGRWGFLPIALQRFLKNDNAKCIISNTNQNLKPNHPCLLRHGIENSKHQSFVACIGDLLSDISDSDKSYSIEDTKRILTSILNIDIFVGLQNGALIDIFKDNEKQDLDLNKYRDSKLYQHTDITNSVERSIFKKVVSAYENYINYLESKDSHIDHKYLWDLITLPNEYLFAEGINLVIIEVNNKDITDDIKILCPSNHYSTTFFDINRKTVIIFKFGNYYEPIYLVEDKVESLNITKFFDLQSRTLSINLKEILNVIKNSLNNYCNPLPSLPKQYLLKENIILKKIIELVQTKGYKLENQVINYNAQVIGLIIKTDIETGYIPCYPSSILVDKPFIWMDSLVWKSYKETVDFLRKISIEFKEIICAPKFKVIEDELIVGIITEANQFVGIDPPIPATFEDGLITLNSDSYLVADEVSQLDKLGDTKRNDYINNLKLEADFFNVFRNTIRILLGTFQYRKLRYEIEKILADEGIIYVDKLGEIIIKLHDLAKDSVRFKEYSETELRKMKRPTNCLAREESLCNSDEACYYDKQDQTCRLVVPKINLINGRSNIELYFGRMADELIRYTRIKNYIFEPNVFLSFSNISYDLKDDEILLPDALLTQSYFDNLKSIGKNRYLNNNSYDIVNPWETVNYSNRVVQTEEDIDAAKCKYIFKKPSDKITEIFSFPPSIKELVPSNDDPLCIFEMLIRMIKYNKPDEDLDITKLKSVLIEEYKNFDKRLFKVLKILEKQGKEKLISLILSSKLQLDSMIMSHTYFLTNFDIMLLVKRYNIPLILLSSKNFIENNKKYLILNKSSDNKYYFMNVIQNKQQAYFKYGLLALDEEIKIDTTMFKVGDVNIINTELEFSIEDYIANFKIPKKKLTIVDTVI